MDPPQSPRVLSDTLRGRRSAPAPRSALLQAELDECVAAFDAAEKDGHGCIDHDDLLKVLIGLGQHPTEEELYQMIATVDVAKTGSLDLRAFLRVVEQQKRRGRGFDAERDMLDAFAAVGGDRETPHGGEVPVAELEKLLNGEFEMDVDVRRLVERVHAGRTTANTVVTYGEFRAMLT